jgi:hypothetical protein
VLTRRSEPGGPCGPGTVRISLGPPRDRVARHWSTRSRGGPRPGTTGRVLDRRSRGRMRRDRVRRDRVRRGGGGSGRVHSGRGLAVPARCPARRAGGAGSTVEAVRARRNPPAVRQSVLASGYEITVGYSTVRSILGPVGAQAAVRLIPLSWSAVQALVYRAGARRVGDQGRAEIRDEMTGRPQRRVSRIVPSRLMK